MDNLSKPRVSTEPTPNVEAASKDTPTGVPDQNLKGTGDELYATYEMDHDIPYLADHYGIKDLWNNKDLTYEAEVNTIDSYLMDEIKSKQLDNNTKAISNRLHRLEKLSGVHSDAPASVKLQQLAEFTKYLKSLSEKNLGVKF